jgi:myo-inositol 2-dehydrogenase/D-chiro-inositol 1-dehydrogenase
MRIGLIGLGRIGAFHARTLTELDTVTELVVTDADPGLARSVAASVGAEAAGSPADMWGAGLDGVVIAAATTAHVELLTAATASTAPTASNPRRGRSSEIG